MSDASMKTYKRETAWAMLAFICGLFVWGAGWENQAATHAAEFLSAFVFIFAAGAFGIEGWRQIRADGPPAAAPGAKSPAVGGAYQ